MDIEEFYDADQRRRASEEIEFGQRWRDRDGVRYELSWVADTGELYVMVEQPPVAGWADPFGGVHVRHSASAEEAEVEGMAVIVVAEIPTREQVEDVLAGWEQAMDGPDGIGWLIDCLRRRGVSVTGNPEPDASA